MSALVELVAANFSAECPMCGAPTKPLLMVAHIQAIVAAYYKIPVREMTSDRRHREVARPRQVAMYLAYETTPKSLPEIGRRFGKRDHTTVIYAIKAVQGRLLIDAEVAEDVRIIREHLVRPQSSTVPAGLATPISLAAAQPEATIAA